MTDRAPPDPPTRADLVRLRLARRGARVAVADAERRCVEETEAAFRRELRSSVRAASPFLVALAAARGLTIDDVAARLDWTYGWPRRPVLARVLQDWHASCHPLCHGGSANVSRRVAGPEGPPTGRFPVHPGGRVEVSAIGHSLEAKLVIGPLTFQTRFGELMIHVRGGLPASLTASASGRPLDDFVLHLATSGRGWLVDAIESGPTLTTLISRTGVVPCSLL